MVIDNTRTRIAVVGVVVVSMFAALIARLWFLEVMAPTTFSAAARANSVRIVHVDPPRGRLLDRHDQVLVGNRIANTVTIERSAKPDALRHELRRLAPLLGVSENELRSRMADPRSSPYKPVPVARDVPEDVVATIRELQHEFPDVKAQELPVREYPLATVAAHVLGYVGEINAEELAAKKANGYRLGDRIGKTGAEQSFEATLRGRPGTEKYAVDARGQVLRSLGGRAPKPGTDVKLTLDAAVQNVAEESLQQGILVARGLYDKESKKNFLAPAGATIVLDSRDGSIVAMASYPTFNPNDFLNGIRSDVYAALTNPASAFPLQNRAVAAQYAPGSTFKLVTALAALRDNLITPAFTYDDKGSVQVGNRVFRNALGRAFGRVNLARALAVSSDSFFYSLGFRFWRQSGSHDQGIQDMARAVGLDALTHVSLGGEQPGRVPDAAWKKRVHDQKPKLFPDAHWFPGDNVNLAVGQGDLLVTPLQLATVYATFANGGTPVSPRLRTDEPPKIVGPIDTIVRYRAAVLEGLRAAVADKAGTAYEAFAGFPLDKFPVYGKTGTAQVHSKQDTSLFAGFVTGADGIPYTVVSVVEEAGFGSTIAAPIVRRIMQGLVGIPLTPIAAVGGVD